MKTKALAVLFFLVVSPILCSAQVPFSPGGNTVSLAVTSTTGSVQIQTSAANPALRVYNSGSVVVFIACGSSAVTAVAASAMPVAPGSVEVMGCGQQYVAGITASGSATVYLTPGAGL